MNSEIGFRPLLEWIERVAILEEDDGGQRPMTLLGRRTPAPGGDPWQPGIEGNTYTDVIPEFLGPLVLKPGAQPIKKWSEIEWLGENLYEVLQGLLEGAHMTKMMQNLDHIQPYAARGCEAWFKIVR